MFLLNAAEELLYVLEDPIRTQVCLRNILEMTLDGMERATQKERFKKLCQIYPQIGRLCDRGGLIPMEYDQYNVWSENARLARMEYLKGKLTAEEFLRRIDTTHELERYEADRAEPIGQTAWQQKVAGNISFYPEVRYPKTLQYLDLGVAEPKWELYTTDDLRREDQKGCQSLREQYGTR